MRIIVVADSHGDYRDLESICMLHSEADLFIHLGDGIKEAALLVSSHPELKLLKVMGNCDYSDEKSVEIGFLEVQSHKIMYTHGHRFEVKSREDRLLECAAQNGADIVLFGHTHEQCCEQRGKIRILNPGSVRFSNPPQFAIIDFVGDEAVCNVTCLGQRRRRSFLGL
ncbi:MAG: metallophosphoesterase [Oscillospiraceae bacterium]